MSGTGSNPPLLIGLHRKTRLKDKKNPLKTPNLFIAITLYVEHDGVNIQDLGRIGEIKILYKYISIYAINLIG